MWLEDKCRHVDSFLSGVVNSELQGGYGLGYKLSRCEGSVIKPYNKKNFYLLLNVFGVGDVDI